MNVARNDDNNEYDDDVTKTLKRSILGGGGHDSDATEEEDFESFLESKVHDKDENNNNRSNSNNNSSSNSNSNSSNNKDEFQKDVKSENISRDLVANETLVARNENAIAKAPSSTNEETLVSGNENAVTKPPSSSTSSSVETLNTNSAAPEETSNTNSMAPLEAEADGIKAVPNATKSEASPVSRIQTTTVGNNSPHSPPPPNKLENSQSTTPRSTPMTAKAMTPPSTEKKPIVRRDPDWEGRPSDAYPGGGSWPEGWTKRVYKRLTLPTSPGKTGPREDRYWYSPDNRKFRSVAEVQRHLEDTGVIPAQKSPGTPSKPKNNDDRTSGNKRDAKQEATSSASRVVDALDALSALKKQFLADAMNIRTATEFLQARTTDIGTAFIEWREAKGMKPLKANGASASVSGWKTAVRNTLVGLGIRFDFGIGDDSSGLQKKKRGRGRPPKLAILADNAGAGAAEPAKKKKKRQQPAPHNAIDPVVLEAEARIGTLDLHAILEAGPKNAFEAMLVKASSSCRSVVDAASTANLPKSAVDWLVKYDKGEAEVLKKLGRPRLSDAIEWEEEDLPPPGDHHLSLQKPVAAGNDGGASWKELPRWRRPTGSSSSVHARPDQRREYRDAREQASRALRGGPGHPCVTRRASLRNEQLRKMILGTRARGTR